MHSIRIRRNMPAVMRSHQGYLEQQWILGDALEGLHEELLHAHHTALLGFLLLLEDATDVGVALRLLVQLRDGDLGLEAEELVDAEEIHALEEDGAHGQVVSVGFLSIQRFELRKKLLYTE